MNQLRPEAERLRKLGYSYNMITEKLGIARSTMSYWFKGQPFTPNKQMMRRVKYGPIKSANKRRNSKAQEIIRLHELGQKELGVLSDRDLWLLGLGLYIGEGHRSYESLRITNSDPAVIVTAIKWFKKSCGLSASNIIVTLHIYPDVDEEMALNYWQTVTGLPRANFRKTSVDRRENKKAAKHGKLPYGTAHLRIKCNGDPTKGVALFRRINGWVAGALNQV